MKKIFLFSSLVLILLQSLFAKQITDKKHYELVGSVKSVAEEAAGFTLDSGQWKENPRIKVSYKLFNNDGNFIEEIHYRKTGNLVGKYEYDKYGYKIKLTVFSKDSLLSYFVNFSYDSNGNLIERKTFNKESDSLDKITYTYDGDGNMIRLESYAKDSTMMLAKVTYLYDAYGNETAACRYDSYGVLTDKMVSYFNSIGILTSGSRYNSDTGLLSTSFYEYDSHTNISQAIIMNSDGSLFSKTSTTFKYDSKGNWIKRTNFIFFEFENDGNYKPHDVDYRKITYYP